MYKNILISTDGSELAHKGVEHGLALAKSIGSKVTVINVTKPYPLQSAATADSWNHAQREHSDIVGMAVRRAAGRHGVEVEYVVSNSESAAEAIVEMALNREVDLIVMASHGRRGVSRLLLGSQTSEVVSHSHIPVLVVR